MKNSYLLILTIAFFGCQKEFPSPPDYSNEIQVEFQEKWKYAVPDDEMVFWTGADEDKVVFLSKNETDITSHIFDINGTLINTFVYSGVIDAKEYLSHQIGHLKGDWVAFNSYRRTAFFNLSNGVFKEYLEDIEFNRDSILNHYLSDDGLCYYQKLDKANNLIIYRLDLATNNAVVYDTLDTNFNTFSEKYFCLLKFNNRENYVDGDKTMIYTKLTYENFNQSTQVSYVGLAENNWGFKNKWYTDYLMTYSGFSRRPETELTDGRYLYVFQNKSLLCVDLLSRKLKWQRTFSNGPSSHLSILGNALIFTEGDSKTMAVNKNSGETIWSTGLGYYPNQIAVSEKYAGLITFREYGEKFDYVTQLHIIDMRMGRELVRTADPLESGKLDLNEIDGGLCKSVSNKENTFFCANKEYFMALDIVEK